MENWFDWFTFDPTINLEGLATAAAAVGAATAYIIDLVRRRLRERADRKVGARGRMILELVQSNFAEGVDETEIYRYLESDDQECIEFRKRYGVKQHNGSAKARQAIETHLIGLLYDRLIELDRPDHFCMWNSSQYRRELLEDAASTGATLQPVKDQMRDELVQNLWNGLSATRSKWQLKQGLQQLTRLGEEVTAERLRAIRQAAKDGDDRLEIDIQLADFLTEKER